MSSTFVLVDDTSDLLSLLTVALSSCTSPSTRPILAPMADTWRDQLDAREPRVGDVEGSRSGVAIHLCDGDDDKGEMDGGGGGGEG